MKRQSYCCNPLACLLAFILCLCLVGCDFNTAAVPMGNLMIERVLVTNTEAYYLAEDGTLYSPGADSDASAFVCYENKKSGIVAKNVADFGTMLSGGYCVTKTNELLVWNKNRLPFLQYSNNRKLQKVADGILKAVVTENSTVYLDVHNRLCLVGSFENPPITFSNPIVLGSNVKCFSLYQQSKILWLDDNGTLRLYDLLTKKAECFARTACNGLNAACALQALSDGSIFLLADQTLYFWGDYDRLMGKEKRNEFSWKVLGEDILCFSATDDFFVMINKNNSAYAFGKCLINGKENTTSAEYGYLENKLVCHNVKFADASSGGDVCFVDCSGKTKSFRSFDRWGFFGNSTKDLVVGLNNQPVTWSH